MTRSQASFVVLVALLLLVPACGGGGGGDDAVNNANFVAPSAVVTSPSVSGVTDEREMTVRGTADPGSGSIAGLRVNGKPASSSNGFATWSATVPIKEGANAFAIVIEDGTGATTNVPFAVRVQGTSPILVEPRSIVIDAAMNRAFVVDRVRRELLTVDLKDGTRKVVSGPELGGGPLFDTPFDLVLDSANQRVLVLDLFFGAIFEVDLLTGDRSILVATNSSMSPNLVGASAIAMRSADRLLAVSSFAGLVEVELSTGKVLRVSDDEPALGPPLSSPRGLAYDPSTDCALVTDIDSKHVFRIDIASGKRELLSQNGVASGPPFGAPAACALDPVNGLVVVDQVGTLVAVDLGSGARTLLSSAGTGSGEPFGAPTDVAIDGGRIYVSDSKLDALVEIDPGTGDRTMLARTEIGFGPFFDFVPELMPSPDGRVLAPIRELGSDEIVAVDTETGTRQIISSNAVGSGETLFGVLTIDIHPETFELLVLDSLDRVFRITPETGARQVVLSSGTGGIGGIRDAVWHPDFDAALLVLDHVNAALVRYDLISGATDDVATGLSGAADVALDRVGNRAVVTANDRVYTVELDTGTVKTITANDDSVGGGAPFDAPGRIAIDSARGVVYMRDDETETILAVDLETGQRTLVSSALKGDGPALGGFGGISLSDDGRTLFAYQSKAAAILAVTIATGDRLVVAR